MSQSRQLEVMREDIKIE